MNDPYSASATILTFSRQILCPRIPVRYRFGMGTGPGQPTDKKPRPAEEPDPRKLGKFLLFGVEKVNPTLSEFDVPDFDLEIMPASSTGTFDGYDGIIIPNGVFEEFDDTYDDDERRYRTSSADPAAIARRELQMKKAISHGAWVCFLINRVYRGRDNMWDAHDLAKKNLLTVFSDCVGTQPCPHIECRVDEFRSFFEDFGRYHTALRNPRDGYSPRTLATTTGGWPVAAAIENKIFFIPLALEDEREAEASRALNSLLTAILAYRRRHSSDLPDWLTPPLFPQERALETQIQTAEQELTTLRDELDGWAQYKGLLSLSGQNLEDAVEKVLRDFFGLPVRRDKIDAEDAVILADDGSIAWVIEVKGASGGLKRPYLNQIDYHRERLQVDVTTPGIVVLNDFTNLHSVEERRAAELGDEHFPHARHQNVKILRTITLIDMISAVDALPVAERKAYFLDRCTKADPVITGS